MCSCTQYDSHCGHSWLSLSDPCGYRHDFLNCPQRNIVQMCIAPAGTCPQCFGGFADSETIEMIQGPWGCNQLIRSHIGGPQAIPGQWGGAQLLPHQWDSQSMLPGFGLDHTLAGPYAPISPRLGMGMGSPGMVSPHLSSSMAMTIQGASPVMECYDGYGGYDGRRNYNRDERQYRKYKHKVTHGGQGCIVM